MRFIMVISCVVVSLYMLGCGREDAQPATPPTPAAAPSPPPAAGPPKMTAEAVQQEAKQIFDTRCMTCHGPEGKGDGPASKGLTPPPRNFHDPEWQKAVTDTYLEQIIQYGGAAVGKSPAMPANPDLMSKPEVVTALRERLRSLGKE